MISENEMKKFFEDLYGEVIEVVFAKNFYGCLTLYRELHDIKIEITKEKNKCIAKKDQESKKLTKLKAKKLKIKDKLQKKFKEIPTSYAALPSLHAIVVFNNITSKTKLLEDYDRSCTVPKKLYFRGKYKLKLSEPANPSDIKWENLEVTCCSHFCRSLFTILFVIILLVLTIAFIFAIQNSTGQLPRSNDCIKYDLSFSIGDLQTRIGLIASGNQASFKNCYCTTQSFISIVKDPQFAACKSYLYLLAKTWGIKIAGMIGVAIVNILLELILTLLAQFKRFETVTEEAVSLTTLLFISSFLNMVVITLFINANWSTYQNFSKIKQSKIGNFFFGGNYADIDREWFVQIGTSFIILGVINILVPQVIDVVVKKPLHLIFRKCGSSPKSLVQL